jgi:hypothetical protein
MLYLLLIQYNPVQEKAEEDDKMDGRALHGALQQQLRNEGKFVLFGGLLPPEYGGTLARVKGGVASDGPFPETKELLGGFYVVECTDAEEAKQLAARVPVDSRGWVEVRQVPAFEADAGRVSHHVSAGR